MSQLLRLGVKMKNNKYTQEMFEKGTFFNPKWLEETKGEKNAWWEDGHIEKIDKSSTLAEPLTNRQRSFELGFLEEMPVSSLKFDDKSPNKRPIKAKYLGLSDSDSETIWAEDFFKAYTETPVAHYNAVVVNQCISVTTSCNCEIILAFQGELGNYFFVKYVKEADTMADLLKEINEDFDCWDEYDTEHDLDALLGVEYHISVDKDSRLAPLTIGWRTKRSKS